MMIWYEISNIVKSAPRKGFFVPQHKQIIITRGISKSLGGDDTLESLRWGARDAEKIIRSQGAGCPLPPRPQPAFLRIPPSYSSWEQPVKSLFVVLHENPMKRSRAEGFQSVAYMLDPNYQYGFCLWFSCVYLCACSYAFAFLIGAIYRW
ncbi:hypothetical protein PAHAL_8G177400 [Panicum hallii]|uniref:Uncharacterized protein n=1 Tax=Panicum hallii TaxID=206008 RepID=A0A2T8I991_9POAL|nr:hypothetical protein PAHAL_8G177400 [Panicum hallii]